MASQPCGNLVSFLGRGRVASLTSRSLLLGLPFQPGSAPRPHDEPRWEEDGRTRVGPWDPLP